MLYSEWLRNWLNIYKKPYIKSWRSIQNFIRLHIPEYIKKTRLNDLNAFVIQKSLNAIPFSRSRVEVYDIYHSSLTSAYKLGFLETDIAYMLVKPKHERKIGSALSSSELYGFIYTMPSIFARTGSYTCAIRSWPISFGWVASVVQR